MWTELNIGFQTFYFELYLILGATYYFFIVSKTEDYREKKIKTILAFFWPVALVLGALYGVFYILRYIIYFIINLFNR